MGKKFKYIQPGSLNERDVFEAGLSFECSANLLMEFFQVVRLRLPGQPMGEFYPYNNAIALASELFFKCLLLIDGENAPQTHDLAVLMEHVKSPRREQLISEYNTLYKTSMAPQILDGITGRKPNDDLVEACNRAKDTFVDSRYWFQKNMAHGANHGIAITLRKVIIEQVRPEWSGLQAQYFAPIIRSPKMRELLEILGYRLDAESQ